MWTRVIGLLLSMVLAGGNARAEENGSKTWCVGRHHFNAPQGFEVAEQYVVIRTMTVEKVGAGGARDFEQHVRSRIDALKTGRATDQGIGLRFRDFNTIGDVLVVGHSIDASLLGTEIDDWTEEAFVLRDGIIFKVTRVLFKDEEREARRELIALARSLEPRETDRIPATGTICLPDATANVPVTAEVHGVTLVPTSGERPVGIRVEMVHRPVGGAPIELDEAMPRGLGVSKAQLGGLDGKQYVENGREVGRIMTVGQQPNKAHGGMRITLEYFDERDDAGALPFSTEWVDVIWADLINSFRPL